MSALVMAGSLALGAWSAGTGAQETPRRGGTVVATWGGLEPQALFVPAGGGSSPAFTLRPGVKWHDGKDFTAEDVVFSAMEYWKPIAIGVAIRSLESATAVDPLTVVFKFGSPMAEFALKSRLADWALVLPKHLSWPGIGSLLFDSVSSRNFPVVLGVMLLSAMLVALANIAIDLICMRLDPRIRL